MSIEINPVNLRNRIALLEENRIATGAQSLSEEFQVAAYRMLLAQLEETKILKQEADAFRVWALKSEWVQESPHSRFGFPSLGMHYGDIMKLHIEQLEAKVANLTPVAWRHDSGPFAGAAITRSKEVAQGWIDKGWKVSCLAVIEVKNANDTAQVR